MVVLLLLLLTILVLALVLVGVVHAGADIGAVEVEVANSENK